MRHSDERPASEAAKSIVLGIEDDIRLILQQNNIPLEDFEVLTLKSTYFNSEPRETLIIRTMDDQSNSKGISPWYQAANDIRNLLDKEVQHDGKIWVEIRNQKLMYRSFSRVPKLGSEEYELLERMGDEVIQEVRRVIVRNTATASALYCVVV